MKYKGYIFAVLSAVFYASIGIFVKSGINNEFSSVDLLMLQEIVSIPILLGICLVFYRKHLLPDRKTLFKLFLIGGVANTLMLVLNYESYKYLSIPVATVILYTYPAMVAVATTFIFKQKVTKLKVLAIAGTMAGCLLVVNIFSPAVFHTISFKGILLALGAAVMFAFLGILATHTLNDTVPFVLTFYNAVFTLAVLLIFNFKFVYKLPHATLPVWSNAALLAIISGIVAASLYYLALSSIGTVPVSIIGTLEIPVAALLSFIIIGDPLNFVQIIGIIVSLCSVIILRFDDK